MILVVCFLCQNTEKTAQTEQNFEISRLQKHFHRKRYTAPILLYNNHVATFQLELSGDVETNPGPVSCTLCAKTVRKDSCQLFCATCKASSHVKCHKNLTIKTVQKVTVWTCHCCLWSVLPFYNSRTIDKTSTNHVDAGTIDHHINTLDANRNRISIAHLNTQSITSSFTEFEAMLMRYKFDIITLSETWLKDNALLLQHVNIPGYKVEFVNRPNKRGGGVGLYIKDNLQFKVRNDINRHDTTIEHLWIEVKNTRKVPFLVGVCYQPSSAPADKEIWIDKMDLLLSHITTSWKGAIIITGDTNINTYNNKSLVTTRYIQTLNNHGFQQHINQPTRNGDKTIDHIASNVNHILADDVIPCDEISDHDAPYVIVNIRKQRFVPRYKFIRRESNIDINAFKGDIEKLPLNLVYSVECPEEKLNIFNELFVSCLNEHAPLIKTKITRPPAPWLKDLNIDQLQRERNVLRKRAHETHNDTDWKLFREKRNELKKCIKTCKRNFYASALSSKRPKEVWSTIHRILNPNPEKITADADLLNQHFNSTAKRLLDSSPKPGDHLKEVIENLPLHENEFKISETTYSDVYKAIQSIRADCSTGYDNIPAKYLKLCIEDITSPICHIINASIKQNLFPNQWKISRISPIPKIKSPKDPSDFRPISILPILSKVYERLIMKQMINFLESEQLLSQYQSGFRKGHCTTTTCIKIRDDILRAMSRGEITLSVMADYSKAFDTVDYETLIRKLHKLRFSKDSMLLIADYLSTRYQYVQIDEQFSNRLLVTNGVPQGSILGPILFNIYVHDLRHETCATCVQYADDTSIYRHFRPDHLNESAAEMNSELNAIAKWSKTTNLVFNGKKTKSVLFATRQMRKTHHLDSPDTYRIMNDGTEIERVGSFKLLGITFNEDLTWNEHVKKTTSSAHQTLRTLALIKRYTPYHLRKQLAEALVLSKIDYGNAVFHSSPAYLINQLQRVQNTAASYVTRKFCKLTDVLQLKWLPVIERAEFAVAKLAWKAINKSDWPKFLPMKLRPSTRTRKGTQETILVQTNNIDGTFGSCAPKIFNNLPQDCRTSGEYNIFIKKTKSFFFDKALARSFS